MQDTVVVAEGPMGTLKRSRALLEREGVPAQLLAPPGCKTTS